MKRYRIIGAYDSETSNVDIDGAKRAFPILHQLGILDCDISEVDSSNVESHVKISLYRHTFEITRVFDAIADSAHDYVPVIMCHNLAFDMHPLSSWISSRKCRVLAKSRQKPITFAFYDSKGEISLVIWDTLVFSQKPLSLMGRECGYEKGSGEWDYSLIRTPETPLSDLETDYAKRDIYSLICWVSYWLSLNPDIDASLLGRSIVTKTGVIRAKRKQRYGNIKGKGNKYNVGRFWYHLNRTQLPNSDDELFTMHAATRGGFTFCSEKWASRAIDHDHHVMGYDATSQHPAQMVAHRYPVDFHETDPENLTRAFRIVARKSIDKVLDDFVKPFPVAFYGCFRITNLRPKKGTVFAEQGIYPLADARLARVTDIDTSNEDDLLHKQAIYDRGYHDTAADPACAFGKLRSAKSCDLWITELTAWEIAQCYDYDDVTALSGYITFRFVRPSDMSVLSVMGFYRAKKEFKKARESYSETRTITNGKDLIECGFSENIVCSMMNGDLSDDDIEFLYLGTKADLNGLYGIECTNEYRKDTIITDIGIDYDGDEGICNAPKNPKAWYQFGQRIVGWSRIAQICVMMLCSPYIDGIANGDTDSVKLITYDKKNVDKALSIYSRAIDRAKRDTCARVRCAYPDLYDELEGIGHYVLEFETDRFYAAWNKAYCYDEHGKMKFTLAGVPVSNAKMENDVSRIAEKMSSDGKSFSEICNTLLGYNSIYAPDVTGLNQRVCPEWGSYFTGNITDYLGNTATVCEPAALALFPMSKMIGDTYVKDNAACYEIAKTNNDDLDDTVCIIHSNGIEWIRGRMNKDG